MRVTTLVSVAGVGTEELCVSWVRDVRGKLELEVPAPVSVGGVAEVAMPGETTLVEVEVPADALEPVGADIGLVCDDVSVEVAAESELDGTYSR